MTAHPKPGTVLTQDSVKLLLPGDVLRRDDGETLAFKQADRLNRVHYIGIGNSDHIIGGSAPPDRLTFVSRPSLEPPASDVAGWRMVPDRADALRVGRAILEAHGQWEKENCHRGSQELWGEQHVILLGQAAMLAAAPPVSEGRG